MLRVPVRVGALRSDLALLQQGLELGWKYGLGSLEELARTAWELEHGIYRVGSLLRTPAGVRFDLRNPPLRIGAFRSVAVGWDGRAVPPDRGWVATDRAPALRPLSSVGPDRPLELEVGEGSRFEIALSEDPGRGPHAVRIEWRSVAVPPLIWLEFTDSVRAEPPG